MDWAVQVGNSCLETLKWLAPLAVAFGVLVRLMPCNRGMYWSNDLRAAATDLLYWLLMPLVLPVCRTLLLAAGIRLLFGGGTPGFRWVQESSLGLQCIGVLLIQDVMLYWIHRGFHTRVAWNFHAIHHSSKVLDWMSSSRFHLINYILSFVMTDVLVLLMGFSPKLLVLLIPFNTIYSCMVHANLNWTFGPFRFVFASPVFHRWHHTEEGKGINKNFAARFPFLDLVFGTFHMPADESPEHFGNGEHEFPEDLWGQFIYPFRKRNQHVSTEAAPVKVVSQRNVA
jgi:sterol desaturase/sphingolipid hydroxylase (fatty acid hydroxylase superfamily)